MSFCFLIISFAINTALFPGLTSNYLTTNSIWFKLSTRFVGLFNELGYNGLDVFNNLSNGIISNYSNIDYEATTSYLSFLFNFNNIILLLIFLIPFSIFYFNKLKSVKNKISNINLTVYHSLFIVLFLTQFSVPLLRAPLFQIVLGASLYPLFINLNIKK